MERKLARWRQARRNGRDTRARRKRAGHAHTVLALVERRFRLQPALVVFRRVVIFNTTNLGASRFRSVFAHKPNGAACDRDRGTDEYRKLCRTYCVWVHDLAPVSGCYILPLNSRLWHGCLKQFLPYAFSTAFSTWPTFFWIFPTIFRPLC